MRNPRLLTPIYLELLNHIRPQPDGRKARGLERGRLIEILIDLRFIAELTGVAYQEADTLATWAFLHETNKFTED